MQSQEEWKQNKSFLVVKNHFFLAKTFFYYFIKNHQVFTSTMFPKVLEAGGTIFLDKIPFWTFFGSKKNPIEIWCSSFQNQKGSKHCKQGSLAKKIVPQASRTFWEHGAREHLMVPGKNVFSQEKMIFNSWKGLGLLSLVLTLHTWRHNV